MEEHVFCLNYLVLSYSFSFNIYFINLAAPGLNSGTWDLC